MNSPRIGIEAFYCQSGLQGAPEKGGVEGQIGWFRRNHCVPRSRGRLGRQVRVHLHASHLVVYDGRTEVARHERLMATSRARLDLDHYLEALLRRPGATALEQARAAGQFHPRRTTGDQARARTACPC